MPAKKPPAAKPVAKPLAKRTAAKAPAKPVGKTIAKSAKSVKVTPAPAKKPATKKMVAKKSVAVKPSAVKVPVKKPAKPAKQAGKAAQLGLPEQIRDVMLRVLDDRQAENILTIDLRGRSSIADYLIIASGRAARQITAIADIARDELAKIGVRQVRNEGTAEGNWVLVDAGDVILHLFRPEVRQFYNIEQIYGEDLPA